MSAPYGVDERLGGTKTNGHDLRLNPILAAGAVFPSPCTGSRHREAVEEAWGPSQTSCQV